MFIVFSHKQKVLLFTKITLEIGFEVQVCIIKNVTFVFRTDIISVITSNIICSMYLTLAITLHV